MAESYAFKVTLAEVGPVPATLPAPARKALLRAAVAWVLELKDAELAKGLDKDGTPMARLKQSTIDRRMSAMGEADPDAPPLEPAYERSRTRSLLAGRAHADHALFFWRYDAVTGAPWGEVLGYHRAGAGPLPVRDVIGASAAIKAEVRTRARKWLHAYASTGKAPAPAEPPHKTVLAPGHFPAFMVKAVPAYVPQFPGLAVPAKPHVVSQIQVHGHVYTLGAGSNGKASAAAVHRGIANGTFSGFDGPKSHADSVAALDAFKAKFGPGGPGAGKAPTPAPKPPKPSPAPVVHPHVVDRVAKPGGRDTVKPMPVSTAGAVTHPHVTDRRAKPGGRDTVKLMPVSSGPFTVPKLKPPPKPKPPPAFPKPASVAGLTDVRALGGHGGGQATLVVDPATGKKYVRKLGAANPGQLREEAFADAAYAALGVPTARSKVYETPGSHPVKLAEFHEGVGLDELRTTDPAAFEAACVKLRKHFVADALLGNWDVVGASYDNIKVNAAGVPLRIDNGGALRYRAQGALKGSAWSGTVGELDSLRNPAMNPTSSAVFGKLTAAEIKKQAKAALGKRAAVLKALPAELHAVINQRFDYLQSVADAVIPKPPKGVKGFKPAPASDFKEYLAKAPAIDWGMRSYKQWGRTLSAAEEEAVAVYTGPGSSFMNPILRAGDYTRAERYGVTRAKADRLIADLKTALAKAKTPDAVVIKRGAGSLADVGHTADTLKPGMPFVDKGFMSATPTPHPYPTELQLVMRFPAGAPGAYVNTAPRSSHPSENEFLVPANTLFRVVSYERVGGKDVVTLQYEGVGP
jgi:hypothetical protein